MGNSEERLLGEYIGELDNDPYCTTELRAGELVIFKPEHVIQVYEELPKS